MAFKTKAKPAPAKIDWPKDEPVDDKAARQAKADAILKEAADKEAAADADAAKKLRDQRRKDNEAIAKALEKAGKYNVALARDGSSSRLDAHLRDGEIKYRWGTFVPSRELTDTELKMLEAL